MKKLFKPLTLRFSILFNLLSNLEEENVLLDSLDHFHALRSQLLHQIENVDFLFLLQPLQHDVDGDESSRSANASALNRIVD
jgi:hypothetical protein